MAKKDIPEIELSRAYRIRSAEAAPVKLEPVATVRRPARSSMPKGHLETVLRVVRERTTS